jgi:hypothetical protein
MLCPHSNPVRPDQPFTLDQCRACWLRLRRGQGLGEGPGPVAQGGPPPAACRHRGDLVPLAARHDKGLGTMRDWYPCSMGRGTNGFVCPCGGCGPLCPDYDPRPPDDNIEA